MVTQFAPVPIEATKEGRRIGMVLFLRHAKWPRSIWSSVSFSTSSENASSSPGPEGALGAVRKVYPSGGFNTVYRQLTTALLLRMMADWIRNRSGNSLLHSPLPTQRTVLSGTLTKGGRGWSHQASASPATCRLLVVREPLRCKNGVRFHHKRSYNAPSSTGAPPYVFWSQRRSAAPRITRILPTTRTIWSAAWCTRQTTHAGHTPRLQLTQRHTTSSARQRYNRCDCALVVLLS